MFILVISLLLFICVAVTVFLIKKPVSPSRKILSRKKVQCLIHRDCWRNFEENFALKAMLDWCHTNKITFSKIVCEPLGQSKPPDYALYLDDKEIALEIVLSQQGFMADGKGIVYKAGEVLPSFCKERDKLKSEINKWISPRDVIYCELSIYQPMKKKQFKSFFRELNQGLKNLYESDNFPSDWTSLEIKIEAAPKVAIRLLQRNGEGSLVAYLKPSGTSLVPLRCDTDLVLKLCIDSKNEKMKDLAFDEKWLVIVPRHPLLDLDDYNKALKIDDLAIICFSKVFIIWDGVAHEMGI